MVVIEIPQGKEALYMDDLDGAHAFELELLLPIGARMDILSKDNVNGVWYVKAKVLE